MKRFYSDILAISKGVQYIFRRYPIILVSKLETKQVEEDLDALQTNEGYLIPIKVLQHVIIMLDREGEDIYEYLVLLNDLRQEQKKFEREFTYQYKPEENITRLDEYMSYLYNLCESRIPEKYNFEQYVIHLLYDGTTFEEILDPLRYPEHHRDRVLQMSEFQFRVLLKDMFS